MGEIAEMMLDGTMCAGCGEWLNDGDDGGGFPEYCPSCQAQERMRLAEAQKERDRIAVKILKMTTDAIENELDAVFCPAIYQHFQAQMLGMLNKLYINRNGAISHTGMQTVVDNNRAAMKKAAKRKHKPAAHNVLATAKQK